jgi:hypothetical protein
MYTLEDIITSDKYLSLCNSDIKYIKTDTLYLDTPIMWRGNIHLHENSRIWISGHSDYGITSYIYNKYKNCNEVWFAINKECSSPNLFAIPLGITNDCDDSPIHRIYGNTNIMLEVMSMEKKYTNLVYMNFSINTFPVERQFIWDLFKDASYVTIGNAVPTIEGRRVFLEEIRNHKFVLCPRGNGIDTHRLWETLYMGSIPIVRRECALEEFTDLPIVWINDWKEVTEDFLNSEYDRIINTTWNMEKLKFSYWKKRICV